MWRLLATKALVSVVMGVLAIGTVGCTQTQVSDTAKGAGGVLVETLVINALDVAFDTNSSTRNLSDDELAQCKPRGTCLPLAHRKEQETDAFIARNRRAYDQLFGYSESDFTSSFTDWKDAESTSDMDTAESTSIMFRQPPLRLPLAISTHERELQLEGAESN